MLIPYTFIQILQKVGTRHTNSLCHKLFSFSEWTNKVTVALTNCDGAKCLPSVVKWRFSYLLCSTRSS